MPSLVRPIILFVRDRITSAYSAKFQSSTMRLGLLSCSPQSLIKAMSRFSSSRLCSTTSPVLGLPPTLSPLGVQQLQYQHIWDNFGSNLFPALSFAQSSQFCLHVLVLSLQARSVLWWHSELCSTEIKEGAKLSVSPLRLSGILWPLTATCPASWKSTEGLLRPVTAFISKILREF